MTGHRHVGYCATPSLPSAQPSKLTYEQQEDPTPLPLKTAPGRTQDSLRRPARSKIRQDGHPLHGTDTIPPHVTLNSVARL
jgi:hypothetical protein